MPLAVEHENGAEHEHRWRWPLPGRPHASAIAVRSWVLLALATIVSAAGCINWIPPNVMQPETSFAPLPIVVPNPALIPNDNRDLVFETVVDVIDDYFKIKEEVPVRLEGDVLVEGLIVTFPRSGSTVLEPWSRDAANFYERVEGTLQSIRRFALVRIIPAEGGFLVDLEINKELEDVLRPEAGSASRAANLRNDSSLRRYIDPVTGTQPTIGWIAMGRDVALEQKVLLDLTSRFAPVIPAPPPGMPLPGSVPPPGVILPPDWVPGPGGTAIPPGGFSGSTDPAGPVTIPPGSAPPPSDLPPPPGF